MRKLLAAAVAVVALGGAAAAGAVLFAPIVGTAQEAPATTAPPATPDAPDVPEDGGRSGGRMFHFFGPGGRLDVAAEAIGIDEAELRQQVVDGKTLAEVAKSKNVDPQKVIDALVKDATTRLDEAVAAGRLTQAQADAIKEGAPERIARFVNEGLPARHGCKDDGDDSGTPAPEGSGTPAESQSQLQGV